MTKIPLPYGLWPSPVTPDDVATQSLRLGFLDCDGEALFWSEGRPAERGRVAIMRLPLQGGAPEEVLPPGYGARTKVHEYGGAPFIVDGAGGFYFINDDDQDVRHIDRNGGSRALTNAPGWRFADLVVDVTRDRLIAVAEIDATPDDVSTGHAHPNAAIVAIPISGAAARAEELVTLVTGADFYAAPRIDPDGRRMAWLAWSLPDMPWDSASLSLAEITADGTLSTPTRVAGGDGSAVFQPEWHADGSLYFVSDASDDGRLFRMPPGGSPAEVETGPGDLFLPLWNFGARTYCCASSSPGDLVVAPSVTGAGTLRRVNSDGTTHQLAPNLCAFNGPICIGEDRVAVIATSDTDPPGLYLVNATGTAERVWPEHAPTTDDADDNLSPADRGVSVGQWISFPSRDGTVIHGVYYPPASATHRGLPETAPPAIIFIHGGPTGGIDCGFKPKFQFWTSRGFAVLDLAYSGTTGFGRIYRQRLDALWGIRDVKDAVDAARHLAGSGRASSEKITISGGSSGGYTVLAALVSSDVFAAGVSSYGISDLALLHATTHKFEAGYLYRLLGATRDDDPVFRDRSPLHHADKITTPVLFFQGTEDKVVPPSQSEAMVAALKHRGIRADYHLFEGEGHGFRRTETIVAVLTHELEFYRDVMALGTAPHPSV